MASGHDKVEKNVGLLIVLTVAVVAIGGLVEIVPLFFQKSTTENWWRNSGRGSRRRPV